MSGKSSTLYHLIFSTKNYSMTTYVFRRYSSKLHRREWHGCPSPCGLQRLPLKWCPCELMVCLQAFSKLSTTAYMGLLGALHHLNSLYTSSFYTSVTWFVTKAKGGTLLWYLECDCGRQWEQKVMHVDIMIAMYEKWGKRRTCRCSAVGCIKKCINSNLAFWFFLLA